jgi:hypothetical protein
MCRLDVQRPFSDGLPLSTTIGRVSKPILVRHTFFNTSGTALSCRISNIFQKILPNHSHSQHIKNVKYF